MIKFQFRTVYKKARFGGTCVEENFWKRLDGDNGVIWQDEMCTLCKEHCASPRNNIIINWPLMKYPGKDRKCVGYCPCKIITNISKLSYSVKFLGFL